MDDERNTLQDQDAEVEGHLKRYHRSDEPDVREDEDEVEAHKQQHHSPQAPLQPSE